MNALLNRFLLDVPVMESGIPLLVRHFAAAVCPEDRIFDACQNIQQNGGLEKMVISRTWRDQVFAT
jgi:hypothetical protein